MYSTANKHELACTSFFLSFPRAALRFPSSFSYPRPRVHYFPTPSLLILIFPLYPSTFHIALTSTSLPLEDVI